MTIALAATFPWGKLRKVVESLPGGIFPGGVVLVTDSRWTYGDHPPEDVGQKLWKVAPQRGIGAVYAGDVWAAEEAIEVAQQRLEAVPRADPDAVAAVFSQALAETYGTHQRKRSEVHPLYALVGMANRHGQSIVMKYSYSTSFRPLLFAGISTIGWPSACQKLERELPEIDEALLPRYGSWSLDIDQWALRVAASTFSLIERDSEPTIGGLVQVATISPKGWADLKIDKTSNPDDPNGWQHVSRTGDLRRWRDRLKVPRGAAGQLDLDIVDLVIESSGKVNS